MSIAIIAALGVYKFTETQQINTKYDTLKYINDRESKKASSSTDSAISEI